MMKEIFLWMYLMCLKKKINEKSNGFLKPLNSIAIEQIKKAAGNRPPFYYCKNC